VLSALLAYTYGLGIANYNVVTTTSNVLSIDFKLALTNAAGPVQDTWQAPFYFSTDLWFGYVGFQGATNFVNTSIPVARGINYGVFQCNGSSTTQECPFAGQSEGVQCTYTSSRGGGTRCTSTLNWQNDAWHRLKIQILPIEGNSNFVNVNTTITVLTGSNAGTVVVIGIVMANINSTGAGTHFSPGLHVFQPYLQYYGGADKCSLGLHAESHWRNFTLGTTKQTNITLYPNGPDTDCYSSSRIAGVDEIVFDFDGFTTPTPTPTPTPVPPAKSHSNCLMNPIKSFLSWLL